jgi:hypothetical protein
MAAGSARETIMSKPVSRVKKALLGALAIATISTGATAVSVNTAEAQWAPRYRGGYGGGYRPNRGAGIAAGIIGGIAAGALIAGATRPAYAAPSYGYGYAPAYSNGYSQPSYYQPAYENYQPAYESYQPTCYFKKVRQVVDYDTVVIRRVRVCQ